MQNSKIESIIKEHIKNLNAIFVFPTQIAADMWADRATLISGVSAVAMERFIAWDDFKGSSIRSHQQDKKSIKSEMRSIFASCLIQKNSTEHFLHYIITDQYAGEAQGFTDSIAKLLPSLQQWKTYFESKKLSPDPEDLDLLELYARYKDFLDQHNIFDPAWETPPFEDNGNIYIIFYPEILMDWFEYKELLQSSSSIIIVHLDNSEQTKPSIDFFQNSRSELRSVAQYLRRMHDTKNISWSDMALSIPDINTYEPYVQRELSIYEIPYVLKEGKPLASYGAGSLFALAQECVQSNFSFDSIKKLLLNTDLPWKDPTVNSALILFGQNNNCLCSYSYGGQNIDVWEQAFKTQPKEERLVTFYQKLKLCLKNLVQSDSFTKIRENYFRFKDELLEMKLCSEQSDLIISRCITELGTLIDLEEEFKDYKVASPFSFFTNYLTQKNYLAQNDAQGVQVIPYKLAALAPFKVQAVIDASQSSISIIYRQLAFLRDDKRTSLGLGQDLDVSDLFIRLYCTSTLEDIYFTAASKTFTGYALSHSYFIENEIKSIADDLYSKEKDWALEKDNGTPAPFPDELFQNQSTGFTCWMDSQGSTGSIQEGAASFLRECIDSKSYQDGKINVSYSTLRSFFECPRKHLFERVLNLEQQNNEADLISPFAMGSLYHNILQLYCTSLKNKNLRLMTTETGLSDEYKEILFASVDNAIENTTKCYSDGSYYITSPLGKELLLATRQAICTTMLNTVEKFSEYFNGCEIAEVESKYTYAPQDKPYVLTGRIDCLLKDTEEAEFILVDFKTSAGAIHSDIFYIDEKVDVPDFQMPIYLYLMENAEKNRKKTVSNCAFYNIKDADLVPVTGSIVMSKKPRNKNKDRDYEPTRQRVLDLIDLYCKKIAEHDFSVNAQSQDFATCQSCSHKAICRRTFTVSKEQ